jgi:hypothetical protein
MDRLQALIALGGDIQNVVFKDDMTWPEVLLLRHCHGNASVTEIMVNGESEREEIHEPERLQIRFGRRYFEVFRLYETNLPYLAPAYVARFDDVVEVVTRVRRDGKQVQEKIETTARPPTVEEDVAKAHAVDPQEYKQKMINERRAKSRADKAKAKAEAERKASQRQAIERREQAATSLPVEA